jgi:hypothetical protein
MLVFNDMFSFEVVEQISRVTSLSWNFCPTHSTAVVTNLFKPKIPDLGLYERQDLPIEELIEKDIPECTSNLRPFI